MVALILFTALVGMLLASPGLVSLQTLVFGLLGIGLAAAAGAALNHVVDQRIDAVMERTRDRPLPSGDLDAPHALGFALGLAALSVLVLATLVNPLTAVLTFCAFIGYAVIYTMYLKRATPQNIVWGGLAGAMPPLLGWTAVTGEVRYRGVAAGAADLRLDAAPFLGSGHQAARRVCPGRDPHAAGNPRCSPTPSCRF